MRITGCFSNSTPMDVNKDYCITKTACMYVFYSLPASAVRLLYILNIAHHNLPDAANLSIWFYFLGKDKVPFSIGTDPEVLDIYCWYSH